MWRPPAGVGTRFVFYQFIVALQLLRRVRRRHRSSSAHNPMHFQNCISSLTHTNNWNGQSTKNETYNILHEKCVYGSECVCSIPTLTRVGGCVCVCVYLWLWSTRSIALRLVSGWAFCSARTGNACMMYPITVCVCVFRVLYYGGVCQNKSI